MRKLTIQSVEDAFFAAMADSYAEASPPATALPRLPGAHATYFVHGDFKVTTCSMTTPYSDKNSATIGIWYKEQFVWTMSYGGSYPDAVIPFLKKCLRRAYVDERQFFGGRGPAYERDQGFIYVNKVKRSGFANFYGEEQVLDFNRKCIGYHQYWGMSLLP
jgi:hypothetical protein